jgi:hypothetical protein
MSCDVKNNSVLRTVTFRKATFAGINNDYNDWILANRSYFVIRTVVLYHDADFHMLVEYYINS